MKMRFDNGMNLLENVQVTWMEMCFQIN